MIVKLLTEHHLEFLSLKGGCRGLSESTLVQMSSCWISHAAAHFSQIRSLTYIMLKFQSILVNNRDQPGYEDPNCSLSTPFSIKLFYVEQYEI